ncbi:MAG: hypothetical protein ACRDH0_06660 [Actinomycetota bacterium]
MIRYRADVGGEGVHFTVGAVVDNCNGGGHLWVAPGTITLDVGPLTRRVAGVERVVHHGSEVVVYESRLIPFWFNTHVVLHDETQGALAAVPLWRRRRLLAVLRGAGFEVKVRRTWLARGDREI